MEINKNDIQYVVKLLEDIEKTGVVCKQDVMSLESMIEHKIDDINVNSFTTIKSSTNVKNLKASLENIIANLSSVKEDDKNIADVFILIDLISRQIQDYIKRLGNNIELNVDLCTSITENNLLTRIEPSGRVNLATNDLSSLNESDLNYLLESINAYLGKTTLDNVTSIINEINILYYQKPKEFFSLLRTLNNQDLTFKNLNETTLSEVTIVDLINEFIVNDKLKSFLINLKTDLDIMKVDFTFDKVYDDNVNDNGLKFTYNSLYKKLENLNYLLNDTMSINMVILFKILLAKNN
jgi:hypothetical protein